MRDLGLQSDYTKGAVMDTWLWLPTRTAEISIILNAVVCGIDLIAAFVILALMVETTPDASLHGLFAGDPQSKWAMFRRSMYAAVAIALFAKGLLVLEGRTSMDFANAVIWFTVLFAVIVFPTLRAFGFINQDRWIGGNKTND
jgi:hypothetical protein